MTVVVVGAGLTGLRLASQLADREPVTLVDRVPVLGGHAGYNHPEVRRFERTLRGAQVTMWLGATACRWQQNRLLVVGHDVIRWLPARHLFVAAGARPATAAELGLVGERGAGVFAATVAKHLLQTRAVHWDRPVVIGHTRWAQEVAAHMHARGAHVTAVISRSSPSPDWADETWAGWTPHRVHGTPRVDGLAIVRDGDTATIACDAIILADGPRPIRNIEGAIAEDANGVTYSPPHPVADPTAMIVPVSVPDKPKEVAPTP
jgi:NADPH-dependent 2,4-dienoyl-CoA reductase/sulfur reductase-like enzyme